MKKLLVIIDMINGFVKEGALADKNINSITPNIINEINKFIKSKNEIICFQDAHTKESVEFESFPEHCIIGTSESELIEELTPYKRYMKTMLKNSTSGFVTNQFLKYIETEKKEIEEIVITGCCTDICVINFAIPLKNYFNENNLKINVTIPKNCVQTYNSQEHNKDEYNNIAFKLMKQSGINII